MDEIAVITDSLACLSKEQVERYGVTILPINFVFEGKAYRDWIDVSPSQAYQFLAKAPQAFETSPPSPGDYLKAYRELAAQARSILCIAASSKLSTLCNNAQIAKELASPELPHTRIEVLDSKTVAAGQALVVLSCLRAAEEGKGLEEVMAVAQEVRERVRMFILLETLRHVYRTGRIPKVASQIASVLPLKPLLAVSEGSVHFAGVARNREKGTERLLRMMRQSLAGGEPVHVAVTHADCPQEGERLKERVSSEFNCAEVFLAEFSPIMGYATGRGVLGLAFYGEGRKKLPLDKS